MGASPGDEDEKPAREVTLMRGFWALSTPVTQAMYEAVMGKKPSHFKGARRPVESVSWYDAMEFCNQLSAKAGLSPAYRLHGEKKVEWLQESEGYRLPTEAEWEYLCRAGSTDSRYGKLDEIAWHLKNSESRTHPVGQKAPNAWGFYDTLGNVWEWCMDEWDDEAYSKLPQVNPAHVPHTVNRRVKRGGSWYDYAWGPRASCRAGSNAPFRFDYDGFRVIRTPRVKAKP
jgi:formylglycine-generating enzyme required for sulfatase activity